MSPSVKAMSLGFQIHLMIDVLVRKLWICEVILLHRSWGFLVKLDLFCSSEMGYNDENSAISYITVLKTVRFRLF